MKRQFLRSISIGMIGGAYVGFFLGIVFVLLSTDYVIYWRSFTHLNHDEEAQYRLAEFVVLAFSIVFAVVGPFMVANASKVMLRPMVYGFVATFATLVGMALISAWFNDEQPFNMLKTSVSTSMDFVRSYGVPISIICGPIFGVLFHWRWSRKDDASQDCSR